MGQRADLDAGRRNDGLTTVEREEMRRENRELREERDTLPLRMVVGRLTNWPAWRPTGTTYDVRVWGIQENAGARGKTYVVRWKVASRRWKATFRTAALADSFRSDLLSAARKGEAFDTGTGRPVSMLRTSKDMSWYAFACAYADPKWPRVAATTRRTPLRRSPPSRRPWSLVPEASRTASCSALR